MTDEQIEQAAKLISGIRYLESALTNKDKLVIAKSVDASKTLMGQQMGGQQCFPVAHLENVDVRSLVEMALERMRVELDALRDSDTRPKDGDAKPGSTRE